MRLTFFLVHHLPFQFVYGAIKYSNLIFSCSQIYLHFSLFLIPLLIFFFHPLEIILHVGAFLVCLIFPQAEDIEPAVTQITEIKMIRDSCRRRSTKQEVLGQE